MDPLILIAMYFVYIAIGYRYWSVFLAGILGSPAKSDRIDKSIAFILVRTLITTIVIAISVNIWPIVVVMAVVTGDEGE